MGPREGSGPSWGLLLLWCENFFHHLWPSPAHPPFLGLHQHARGECGLEFGWNHSPWDLRAWWVFVCWVQLEWAFSGGAGREFASQRKFNLGVWLTVASLTPATASKVIFCSSREKVTTNQAAASLVLLWLCLWLGSWQWTSVPPTPYRTLTPDPLAEFFSSANVTRACKRHVGPWNIP